MGPCAKRCLITKETRNNCARCRFERCITVGMAVEKIRFGKTPKHVANLIMNATSSRTISQNFLLNSVPGTVNMISNGLDANSNYLNKELHNNNNNNQNLEKLILSLTSYIDATTQEYFSMLRNQFNQSTSSSSYSSFNSNQQNNTINFSSKTQCSDFQTSSIYLTPSTSSSLPQSKSTSPYLLHNIPQQQQPQQHQVSTNVSCIQDLIRKLKQKVIKKLNDYLSDTKSNNESSNNPEKENFKFNCHSSSKENNYQNSNSLDSLVVAFLVLIISDQVNQLKIDNDVDENILQQKTLASYFDLEFNLITNKISKVLIGSLKSIFDRIYRNANEDSNRVIKMLHFILILLMQNYYTPSTSKRVNHENNNFDYNNYYTDSTVTNTTGYYEEQEDNDDDDEDDDENEDDENVNNVNNNKNFKLLRIIAGLIGLKCQNKLTKNRILLNLETFV
jgi:hypothetical protein